MGKIAFVFPGQGSQLVGMGQSLFYESEQAAHMFKMADERLSFPLTELIFNGPQKQLTLTENAQPALLTVSMAILEVFKSYGITADFAAGHSLGEYSALVAAGALSFTDAVYAVRRRGLLMEEAVPAGEGTMAAVLGMETGALQALTDQVTEAGQTVQLANINCPGQIVISGTKQGVEEASALVTEQGGGRVIPLDVSGPFHSQLMKPAAEKLAASLEELTFQDASIPVIANVTAKPTQNRNEIKQLLVEQLYSPVMWEQSVRTMLAQGVDTFVEIGPGKVLSGLIRKVERRVNTFAIHDLQSIETTAAKMKEAH